MKKANKLLSFLISLLLVTMLVPMVAQAATLTTVTVKKTDIDGNPLADAVFTLTGTGNSINTNYSIASDENGIAEFIDVADGTYDLAEAMAPKGYVASNEVYHIAVNTGMVYRVVASENDTTGLEYLPYETITFVNEKVPTYPVTVKKTDENGSPLAGAIFTLTGTGNYVGQNYEATSDKDGNATFQVWEGWYKLAEKTAPDGYLLSDVTYDLVVSEGGISTVEETDNGFVYTPVEKLVYVNEAEPTCAVTVKKADKEGNPLAGAVFTLTGTGNYIGRNYEATSDADGNAVFQVREGYYTLAERTAPDGYIRSDKTYEIAVSGEKVLFVGESDNGITYSDYETVTYVNEKVIVPENPQTDDTSNFFGWFTLLFISGGAAVGATVYGKKRKESAAE